jgi:ribonuclease HIII
MKSFQTLDTSENHDKIFVLLSHKILQNLLPNSTNIQCKSFIDKYKNHVFS